MPPTTPREVNREKNTLSIQLLMSKNWVKGKNEHLITEEKDQRVPQEPKTTSQHGLSLKANR